MVSLRGSDDSERTEYTDSSESQTTEAISKCEIATSTILTVVDSQ